MKNLIVKSQTRYIVVLGGVVSGSGKGVTATSIAACLKARDLKVNIQKIDMYLNVDAGTLKPAEHGEVFVTDDGSETDLDLGHYERFLDVDLGQDNSVMQGRILQEIITKERAGGFSGDSVQVIPHVTGAIQDKIIAAGQGHDVHVVELGGTVGDYEGLAFVEAVRQLSQRVGRHRVLYVYVVFLPFLKTSAEIKTKPAQNACRDLRSVGIIPDILVGRTEEPPTTNIIDKLSLFANVKPQSIIILPNVDTIYRIPLILEANGLASQIARWANCRRRPKLANWRRLVKAATRVNQRSIKIGMVVKYLDNKDTYKSLTEAMSAAAWQARFDLDLSWVSAEELERTTASEALLSLMPFDGILIPGGFGARGVDGMILTASYAINNNVPYLGICLGMQVGVIAWARIKTNLKSAHSREFRPQGRQLVIDYMPGQKGKQLTGGQWGSEAINVDSKK